MRRTPCSCGLWTSTMYEKRPLRTGVRAAGWPSGYGPRWMVTFGVRPTLDGSKEATRPATSPRLSCPWRQPAPAGRPTFGLQREPADGEARRRDGYHPLCKRSPAPFGLHIPLKSLHDMLPSLASPSYSYPEGAGLLSRIFRDRSFSQRTTVQWSVNHPSGKTVTITAAPSLVNRSSVAHPSLSLYRASISSLERVRNSLCCESPH